MGHRQQSFFNNHWRHRYSHGGILRNQRRGRGSRPLSTKASLHLVFKINPLTLRHRSLRSNRGLPLVLAIIKKYSGKFAIKIEQVSVQNDHLHALIRTSRRSQYLHFFRVVAGQIAQQFEKQGLLTVPGTPRAKSKGTRLWKYRPFSRVIQGWKAHQTVRNYIQLNEKEILGQIRYQKERLRGLSSWDWEILWS